MQTGVDQVPGKKHPTVGNGVQIAFAPIPRHVKADSPPQIARPPQRQTQKETDQARCYEPNLRFARIVAVDVTERKRQKRRRRPEVHRLPKHPLRVTADQEFFKQSCQQKKHRVKRRKLPDARTVQSQRQRSELKRARDSQSQHKDAQRPDPPQRSHPEISAKGAARWQAELAEWPVFDVGHQKTRQDRGQHQAAFDHHAPPEDAQIRPQRHYQPAFHLVNGPRHRQVNQPANGRVNALRTDETIAQHRLAATARRAWRRW